MVLDDPQFLSRVLRATERDRRDDLMWCVADDGRIAFSVPCSDVFCWGAADAEDLTPENVGVYEQAVNDCEGAKLGSGDVFAGYLFCARVRKMRPQGAMYRRIDEELWPLFDACGPLREVDVVNPDGHPSQARKDGPR